MRRSDRMSTETMRRLEAMGWYFFPSGPNEYEWMKFNKRDERIAVGGDWMWRADLLKAERPEVKPWWRFW